MRPYLKDLFRDLSLRSMTLMKEDTAHTMDRIPFLSYCCGMPGIINERLFRIFASKSYKVYGISKYTTENARVDEESFIRNISCIFDSQEEDDIET